MNYFVQVALIVATIWGSIPFFTKHLLKNMSYKSIGVLQSLLSAIVGGVFCYYNLPEIADDFKHINYSTIWLLTLLSVMLFCANLFYYMVIRDHETYLVASITSIYPLIALVISYLFLNENITYLKFLGIVLVASGIICIAK